MGCGGSKHDVATGNAVKRRFLPKKASSEVAKSRTLDNIPEASSTVERSSETETVNGSFENENQQLVTDVKDIIVNTEENEGCFGECKGKVVCRESPDRYFSSRKEEGEEGLVGLGEGFEYYSPRYEPRESGKILHGEGEEGEEGEEKGKVLSVEEGENKACKEEENLSDKESVDLKEPILVEETEANPTIEGSKALDVGKTIEEIVSMDSSTEAILSAN
ncbi:uncharacterized protein LOC143852199 [Tasmannia lanceolata]|uniref:uncharacterized protein LOC143852199 n=1 Tax=Tasmannia lanceolata TaxID=3420 RepID=UPI0040643B3E